MNAKSQHEPVKPKPKEPEKPKPQEPEDEPEEVTAKVTSGIDWSSLNKRFFLR